MIPLALLLLSPAPTIVVEAAEDRTIHAASQLAPWCREEAEARVVAEGRTPYQWTASYHDRGNRLHVEGTLRVDGDHVGVRCTIARGARRRAATIEFVARDR